MGMNTDEQHLAGGKFTTGILVADTYQPAGGSVDSISDFTVVSVGGVNVYVSAALEVQSTTGSLLISRMTTAQKNALIPFNGMMVYDTTLNAFSFYEAGAWISLPSAVANAYYVLLHNEPSLPNSFNLNTLPAGLLFSTPGGGGPGIAALTTPIQVTGSNGAANNNNLHMTWRGTFYGISPDSAGGANTSFGIGTMQSITGILATNNTAFGFGAMIAVTTAQGCTSFGANSIGGILLNATGSFNTALGEGILPLMTVGESNTCVGAGAGANVSSATPSNNNVFVGDEAGATNQIYNNCTLIGTNADCANPSQTNSIAIGFGAIVSASNTMVLGNGVDVQINTGKRLQLFNIANTQFISHAAGTLGSNTNYKWPNDGAAGQSLTTDGAGNLSWTTPGAGVIVNQTTTPQAMAVDSTYIANTAGLLTFTLPTVSNFGDQVTVSGFGAGGWRINQPNAGSQIVTGNGSSTVGAGGFIASGNRYDTVYLMCITANAIWKVIDSTGGALTIA